MKYNQMKFLHYKYSKLLHMDHNYLLRHYSNKYQDNLSSKKFSKAAKSKQYHIRYNQYILSLNHKLSIWYDISCIHY